MVQHHKGGCPDRRRPIARTANAAHDPISVSVPGSGTGAGPGPAGVNPYVNPMAPIPSPYVARKACVPGIVPPPNSEIVSAKSTDAKPVKSVRVEGSTIVW